MRACPSQAPRAAVAGSVPYGDGGGEPEGDYCMPSEVEFDNTSHEAFTVITLEVQDYPGACTSKYIPSWELRLGP